MRENDVERKQLLMKRIIGFNNNYFIFYSLTILIKATERVKFSLNIELNNYSREEIFG